MEVFVARQPIVDRQQKIFGYELLFRQGFDNFCNLTNGDRATADVITTSFILVGIESLTGRKRAFINFTNNLLKDETAAILPKKLLAIEILEDVRPEPEIIAACKRLKRLGYMLVLDDFVFNQLYRPFIELADIIKIDFLNYATFDERKSVFSKIRSTDKIKFLAEKVETREAFDQARELGYSYFQGYYFSKPVIVRGHDIPGFKMSCLQIIKEVNKPDPDFDRLEEIIKKDLSFTYKLLKLINSAAFGFNTKIKSLKHALVLLGVREVRKWVSLNALRGLAKDKPDILMIEAIIRGRFCELIAPRVNLQERSSDLFLMGIFSLIDAFIDRPMPEILAELPLEQDIKEALLGADCHLRHVLELVTAYDKGDWATYEKHRDLLKIQEEGLPELYAESLEWGNYYSSF